MRPDLIAFDLYGTLLDVSGLAQQIGARVPDPAALVLAWRKAQLELTGAKSPFRPFDQLTAAALAQVAPGLSESLRDELCGLWLRLPAHPGAKELLQALERNGIRRAVLSNGTQAMIEQALAFAGLPVDAVLSVDRVQVYKPDPRVYALLDGLAPRERTLFLSANGWDAEGARRDGRRVAWIDRGTPPPELPPDFHLHALGDLAAVVLTDWRERGVRVVRKGELDLKTAQTPGMNRAAAITHASAFAQKLWAGTVTIHPDAKTGAHHHGDLESVIFVVRGKARMRWGERLEFMAEAGPGDFIFVPPFVPHQEINASRDEPLECVLVRSGQDPIVVNLEIEAVEPPEAVRWVDPIHR